MFNALLFKFLQILKSKPRLVVLRDEKSGSDLRHLSAAYTQDGDLVIEGQDLGDGVEAVLGCREYEWTWTIAKSDLAHLADALVVKSNLLDALKRRYGGDSADQLLPFLNEHKIPYKVWTRIGD